MVWLGGFGNFRDNGGTSESYNDSRREPWACRPPFWLWRWHRASVQYTGADRVILEGVKGGAKAKRLVAQFILKFFKHFPELAASVINAQLFVRMKMYQFTSKQLKSFLNLPLGKSFPSGGYANPTFASR